MELSTYIEALRHDLEAAADPGDEAIAAIISRLGRAIEASLRLQLLDALGEASLELNGQLPAGRVEVRLAGRDVSLVFVQDPDAEAPVAAGADEDLSARVTLRLPEGLKVMAEEAAAREGQSMNTWLVGVVRRSLHDRPRGHRLRGFAQS
jgi:hypothetical protein